MDFTTSDIAPADSSTTIDTDPRPSEGGGGATTLQERGIETDKPARTAREDLEHVFKADAKKQADDKQPDPEVKGKDEKAAEPPAKPEEGKEAAPKADDQQKTAEGEEKPADSKDEPKQDGRRIEPPARFQPDAKEKWTNVPRSVQRDVEIMSRDHDTYKASHERYETVRDFDELAKSNGRELRDSLEQVHRFENMMRENPIAALNMALQQVGPRRADGSAISLFEVAQHVVNQGQQGYQQSIAQANQQMQQTAQQRQTAQQQQETARIQAEEKALQDYVIAPFREANPRYDELEPTIAYFLTHGNIDPNLSVPDRLKAAYDMAVRINPASRAEPEDNDRPDPARRADDDLSGSKSIKSALGSVSEDVEDSAKAGESRRDSILKEMRRLNAR